jgi:hypothetical protein
MNNKTLGIDIDMNILHFYDLFLLGNPDRLSPGFSRDTDQQLIGLS